jgi:glycogen operon protein
MFFNAADPRIRDRKQIASPQSLCYRPDMSKHIDKPVGIRITGKDAQFTVHSTATVMNLLLFDSPEADTPVRKISMEKENGMWCAAVPNIEHGQLYLYEADGRQLLDPCARALHTPRKWGERTKSGDQKSEVKSQSANPASCIPHPGFKCVVVKDSFDWGKDKCPQTPLKETIIYEAHLRGFTKSESDGTYLDFIEKIPYLKELGITAVEFLPLFEFNELEFFLRGDNRKDLLNFWGYSTLGFFAPMSRYAASGEPGAAVTEFKQLVKALHAEGIEVILDVVFNHTGEGEKEDPTYHFRRLDEDAYYIQNKDGTYQNWTGCGNTVNANHPVTRQFIVECLKYWVTEMHVDGIRFDLATSLCRSKDGELLDNPPLFQALEKEPVLKQTKLIAEAWDLGGYQVGHFPCKRFSDWNGKYRDDVRRFWNCGEPVAGLATRLAGSEDLYGHKDSRPLHSINFITSHDGFTLADLVSYEHKYNEANGEENRDGEQHNESVNFGVEGPTDDLEINARRLLQQKNLLTTLFLSQGVPMLTAGDEFGRTQKGNNNAYCQDNDISWVDWSLLKQNSELFKFTQKLIALRKAHPALRRSTHFTERDVEWLGPDGGEPDWKHDRTLGMLIKGPDPLLILINNADHEVLFEASGTWELALSTASVSGFAQPPHSLAVYTIE